MGAREDMLDVLRKFPGHVLVLVGEKDVITPVEKAKAMAEACPGATLVVVEGAGHLAHLEKPERGEPGAGRVPREGEVVRRGRGSTGSP